MPWLQPFVKAAGTVPLPCCCPAAARWVQQAWARREGRAERPAGTGRLGREVPRVGVGRGGWGNRREVPAAAVMELHGRGWKGHRTPLLSSPRCPRPAGIPRAPLPSPRSGEAAMTGEQLGWVSGLCVKASVQL